GISEVKSKSVLIIDQIGLLSQLYQYGDIAFIGGAFGRGLHNILEPAVQSLPIIFGPGYHKFSEAVDLVQKNAAFPIRNYEKFVALIDELMSDEKSLFNAGAASRMYVQSQAGATALSISCLMENI
ncbi:MAG: 3-deoxy-D-manno-octulosonic acid transferase, partial [Bacteroidales bacterium]|nr:3-deoxy-D-manno-octulosonic acid transferase [Bacteroidales bacterium]